MEQSSFGHRQKNLKMPVLPRVYRVYVQLESESQSEDLDKIAYKIYVEIQRFRNHQGIPEEENGVGSLNTCLTDVKTYCIIQANVQLVQVQRYQPMKQNKEPKNRSLLLQNSDVLQQWHRKSREMRDFLLVGAGKLFISLGKK